MIGIRIRNDADELIIDGAYKGYALIEQGAVVLGGSPVTRSFGKTITSIDPPIVAVQRWAYTGLYPAVFQLVGGPGAWTGFYAMAQRNVTLYPSAPASASFNYRVYAADTPSAGEYGLRVRASDDLIAIDSGKRQLTFDFRIDGDISGFTKVAQISGGFQSEAVFAAPNITIKPDDWLPLSLVTASKFVKNSVIYPDKTETGPMAVQMGLICLNSSGSAPWSDEDRLGIYVYMEDISGRPPQNYTIPFLAFCAVIKN